MSSPSPPSLERATPLFGTLARIRVEGCGRDQAMESVSAAFAAMARVHRLMSFQEPDSELSAMNRSAHAGPVRLSPPTLAVLAEALQVARLSGGAFDPTVGAAAVRAGALPRPDRAPEPDPRSTWRDIELDVGSVRFRRPLWLDLGGIAKGYAVDVASAILRRRGVSQACVEAGGDLRVFGRRAEVVALDPGIAARHAARAVSLANRSLASSGEAGPRTGPSRALAVHFDPNRRRRTPRRFVSVAAPRCVLADALTKVVLARGRAAAGLLHHFAATAAICSPALRWSVFGAPSP
jgi:thiamine biosynthesis lipoprotein